MMTAAQIHRQPPTPIDGHLPPLIFVLPGGD